MTRAEVLSRFEERYPYRVERRHELGKPYPDETLASAFMPHHPRPEYDVWFFVSADGADAFIRMHGGSRDAAG